MGENARETDEKRMGCREDREMEGRRARKGERGGVYRGGRKERATQKHDFVIVIC